MLKALLPSAVHKFSYVSGRRTTQPKELHCLLQWRLLSMVQRCSQVGHLCKVSHHGALSQGTFYGQDPLQDAAGACSFNENYANLMSYPWSQGTMVTIAINREQFDNSKGCGTCIMYRGTGGGIGVTPPSTTQWTMGIVNNQ
jgi:hypothetical protein